MYLIGIDIKIGLFFFSLFLFSHLMLIYGVYVKYNELQNEHENFFNETSDNDGVKTIENIIPFEQKKTIPYEEKYLLQIRDMKNEYVFTDEELELEKNTLDKLREQENTAISETISTFNNNIDDLKIQLLEIETTQNDNTNAKKDETILRKIKEKLQSEIELNEKKILELQENASKNNDLLEEKAKQYVIDEQLKKFKKKFIIEYTPLGNVLLFYNHDKLAFEYYSDLTIPYRYLETVVRKYILTYNYRPLYIDMEEELKEYERKIEENDKLKAEMNNSDKLKKPQVFAKFKSYNTDAGTGRVNKVPPPKNSIPQNKLNISKNIIKIDGDKKENGKLLLKEKANRYSYQGKMCNFNFLQKIDKKVVDKKYALTFADFKKMNMNKS